MEIFNPLFDIIREFGNLIAGIWGALLSQFDVREHPLAILDIAIVVIIFYWIYRWIRNTKAQSILYGIIILILLMFLSSFLGLFALNWLIRSTLVVLLIAIPVVFQPELRNALERLGRGRFIEAKMSEKNVVEEIIRAVDVLSKNKTGALIAIQRKTGLIDFARKGVVLDARLSAPLILNIFYPKSPLHDGAVIISGDRVVAAGCMLPLSEGEVSFMMGTRHRAALGMSEETDAVVIVISEETGKLSLALDGKMDSGISPSFLKKELNKFFKPTQNNFLKKLIVGK